MRRLRWAPIVLVGLFLGAIGYGMLWTTMMAYDDEGYVLYSLRAFSEEGGLYEKIFSQYGPFFYLWNRVISFVGFDYSNTAARVITLIYWMIAACAGGVIVARLTRSVFAASAAMILTFWHLWPMISEPSHPGGIICAVLAFCAWIGTAEDISPHQRGVIMGAAGAALVLIKINVGIFFVAGSGAWWVLSSRELGTSRQWRVLIAVLVAALPVLLMRQLLLIEPWVFIFALVAACTAIGVVFATPEPARPVPLSSLWRGVVAGLLVVLCTLLFVRLTGTSWSGILEGVILGPLRHPLAYSSAVRWRPGAATLALLTLALIFWLCRKPPADRYPWVVAGRGLAALGYLLSWSAVLPLEIHAYILSYGLASTAWFVLPLRAEDSAAGSRAWLGVMVATQVLHAFPVAGSQICWGTFLWMPLATAAVHDAYMAVIERGIAAPRNLFKWIVPVSVAGLVLIKSAFVVSMVVRRFPSSDALGLPGASDIYLPHSFTSTIRILTLNSSVHAQPLFSLPGMLSFHAWSDVAPPTVRNTTHWFTLLKPAEQEEIRQRLASSPRAVVIVQRTIYDYLIENKTATESELTRWLHENFEPAFKLQSYEFWVHRGRTIAPIGTVRARQTDTAGEPRYRLEITVADPRLQQVAAITLEKLDDDAGDQRRQQWDSSNSRLQLTPLASSGQTRGPARETPWPFTADQLMRVELFTDALPKGFSPSESILHFRDATGRILSEARFVD